MKNTKIKMEPELHKRYLFGSGIILKKEFVFAADVIIRPISLTTDPEKLARYTSTQVDFGFLCALAQSITFELEITGLTDEEVAKKAWNYQWLIILLSVVLRSPVNSHIESIRPHSKMISKCCWVTAYFISGSSIKHQKVCPDNILMRTRDLARNFENLNDRAFMNACAIACNNFNEPRKSIRMASIWSAIEGLIGVSQELTYRIPLICSLILKETKEERLKLFKEVQNLYGLRSKCVHGDNIKPKELDEALVKSHNLLCDLIEWTCEQGEVLTAQKAKELPIIYASI